MPKKKKTVDIPSSLGKRVLAFLIDLAILLGIISLSFGGAFDIVFAKNEPFSDFSEGEAPGFILASLFMGIIAIIYGELN